MQLILRRPESPYLFKNSEETNNLYGKTQLGTCQKLAKQQNTDLTDEIQIKFNKKEMQIVNLPKAYQLILQTETEEMLSISENIKNLAYKKSEHSDIVQSDCLMSVYSCFSPDASEKQVLESLLQGMLIKIY